MSLGKTTGAKMQRTPSHESLTTHPLLSPPLGQLEQDTQPTPRYVPYTPRHRAQHSASVPATSTSPQPTISISNSTSNPSFQASTSPSGVTGRLQLQNLKAEAQGIGLGNESVGWGMLEKLCSSIPYPENERSEWDEIWDLLTKGQATLLLPSEPLPGNVAITPELLRDHLALCNPSNQTSSPVVTISGVRGSLQGTNITFRSLMNTASINFKSLLSAATRSTALASLPPLPVPLSPSPTPPYPSVQVQGQNPALPLLPRPIQPPPLPARPGTAAAQQNRPPNPPPQSATSRLNPFASLFGSRSTPTPTPPPIANVTPAPLAPPPPSDTGSARSSIDLASSEGPLVPAITIDRRISRAAIAKDATRAIKGEIKSVLSGQGVPSWVKDRVIAFVNPLLPIPKASRRMSNSGSKTPTPDMTSPQACSDSIQYFLSGMEDELFAYFGNKRKEDPNVDEKAATDRADNEEKDRKMRGVMEKVERSICALFYDRLFRPSTSDDASHDDALSSQIASLNMLDIGLNHLGVEVPRNAEKGVKEVIKACGQELQRLGHPDCRSPAEKAAVFVSANRAIAEGLSRLPPLRLKSENEMAEERTPTASAFRESSTTSPPQATPEIVMSPDSDPQLLPTDSSPAPKEPLSDPLSTPASPALSSRQLPPEQGSKGTSPSVVPGLISQVDGTASPSPAPSINIQPTAVSSDVLLPVMIYAVVKTNPSQLVSHLLYVQRFRSRSVGGEESFCLINLMAVVEFLENVDLAVLGLASSEKVMSVADLTPIPLAETVESAASASHHPLDIISASIRLRGKVNQVGEMAGSAAGKVILGVMDTSMLALKGLLGTDTNPDPDQRPGFGLLRRGTGFSIASVAASLPAVGRGTPRADPDVIPQEGRQLVEVSSRPGSLRSVEMGNSDESGGSTTSSGGSEDDSSDEAASDDDGARGADTRSVRSFSSMLSRGSKDDRRDRLSLQDRLANMSNLSKFSKSPPGPGLRKLSPPSTRRTSLLVPAPLVPGASSAVDAPPFSPISSNAPRFQIPPPVPRFLECSADDLKLSEVADLLADYKRLAAGMQAMGGFSSS
ncbi:Nuclear receptor corepressor 2 [Rhizoctonia solani]|uniref:Nuclear receptor corepressor 2 n=1 Tax=Rhizoctonia solani TaxID=456999 RepID=A0A0K6GHM7_9AGAM|nr:Nuclear receptor corepressor 2 [Rhizoctonia solani]